VDVQPRPDRVLRKKPPGARGLHRSWRDRCRASVPDPAVEGLRYFHFRYLWERKRYSELTNDNIEFLNEAAERYRDPRIEALYQPFMSGQIPAKVVTEQFRKLAPKRDVSFRTEVVDGQATLFESNLPRRSPHQTETRVTGYSELTFGPAFKGAFGAEAQQTEEK
jgi:hypothetical protein